MGRQRTYQVWEPMEAFNVFTVRATSREEAERLVRDQDESAILHVEMSPPRPSMRKWTVRWMRSSRP